MNSAEWLESDPERSDRAGKSERSPLLIQCVCFYKGALFPLTGFPVKFSRGSSSSDMESVSPSGEGVLLSG